MTAPQRSPEARDYRKMTQPERARLRGEYAAAQNQRCHYCDTPLDKTPVMEREINWRCFPGGIKFLNYPVHLHHNHKNGMTIGAVHAYCNAVLWQYHGE